MHPRIHHRIAALTDRWLDEFQLDRRDMAAYRVLYAVVAIVLLWNRAAWTADLPSEFWKPPFGLPQLLGGFPSASVVLALNVALTASLLALAFGFRFASFVVPLLILVLNSWEYAPGKINHDILLVLIPMAFAFAGWDRGHVRGWPVLCLAICIAFAMCLGGWGKLDSGWLALDTQATRGHLIKHVYGAGRGSAIGRWLLSIDSWFFWESQDWAATLMEFLFPLAMFRLRWFRAWLGCAAVFHVGVMLSFAIPFATNILAYLAFFPVARMRRHALIALPPSVAVLWLVGFRNGTHAALFEVVTVLGAFTVISYLSFHKPTPGPP